MPRRVMASLVSGLRWLFHWHLAGLLLFALAGCGRAPLHQSQAYVFGTLVDVSIYGEPEHRARALENRILQEFQRLHDSLHAWKAGSELDRVNTAFAAGKSVDLSPELAAILTDATALSERSGGLFNPAIGHLIALWGFQRDEFVPVRPDPAMVQRWVSANPRMADIVITGRRAFSRNPAVRIDLGGYAKGYALDRAAHMLRREKVHGALINIGGNIIAVGRHGDRSWRVGIQHPRRPGPLATLELPDGWAIGTSGDYQRFFELDGQRYCHLIDPRSGRPATGVQAVTVLIPPGPQAGTLSDVASKPPFIAGVAGWRAAAAAMGVRHAMLVDAAGRIHLTPALRPLLHFVSQDVQLEE
ncbi:MAG: FAD:protein FMN transferase [Methylophilaceae bacterium]|nr:FAD:protein FMN transferase [Methylophilaceae bacterium]